MLKRRPDVTYKVVPGRALLVDADGKELITLTAVGVLVWEALAESKDTETLVRRFLPELGVTRDKLTQDIGEILCEFLDLGLIREVDAPI